jgi:phosphatidylethanolamine-binding protein (PEBP) family uncharacterized protein
VDPGTGPSRTPADVAELRTGAGDDTAAKLPDGAIQLAGDAGLRGYPGAPPPAGHDVHHYHVAVHAVDVPSLQLPDGATPAFLGFNPFGHTLARAVLVPVYEA